MMEVDINHSGGLHKLQYKTNFTNDRRDKTALAKRDKTQSLC